MRCGVGYRCGLDPALLGLWCRLAAAVLIQPLAQELPYALGMALKKKERKNPQDPGLEHAPKGPKIPLLLEQVQSESQREDLSEKAFLRGFMFVWGLQRPWH